MAPVVDRVASVDWVAVLVGVPRLELGLAVLETVNVDDTVRERYKGLTEEVRLRSALKDQRVFVSVRDSDFVGRSRVIEAVRE